MKAKNTVVLVILDADGEVLAKGTGRRIAKNARYTKMRLKTIKSGVAHIICCPTDLWILPITTPYHQYRAKALTVDSIRLTQGGGVDIPEIGVSFLGDTGV